MPRRGLSAGRWIGACFLLAILAGSALGQEPEVLVPADLQARILVNALTFDRNLKPPSGELRFGVLIQRRYLPSVQAGEEMLTALRQLPENTFPRLRLQVLRLELKGDADLRTMLEQWQPDILYVSPLRALTIHDVAAVSRDLGIRTVTGVAEYVPQGLSLGLRLRGSRPEILINRKAAISEGADFTSQLLSLSRVVE